MAFNSWSFKGQRSSDLVLKYNINIMLHCITAESINFNRRLEKYNLPVQDFIFTLMYDPSSPSSY